MFPHLAWEGIVPNFCLLVVVAAALVRGPAFAATLGFFAGLMLDLAPPADHVAGRWALALVVVGYVAGLMRQDTRPSATTVVAHGRRRVLHRHLGLRAVRRRPRRRRGRLRRPRPGRSLVALLWDVLLTPLVLPGVMRLFTRLEPAGAR